MKWNKSDISKYVQAEEYIDTAIIPLVPFTLKQSGEALTQLAFQKEVLELLANRVEGEFAGRVMLFPTITYLSDVDRETELNRLKLFEEQIATKPFKFTFYLTFDSKWKVLEPKLSGNLIWMPVLKEGDLQNTDTHSMIMDQVQQITELIRIYWKG